MESTETSRQLSRGRIARLLAVAVVLVFFASLVSIVQPAEAAPPPKPGKRILVLHDSVVTNARDSIIAAFPNHRLEFVGFGGLEVSGAIELLQAHPRLVTSDVIVELGTNYNNKPKEFRRHLDRLMRLLGKADHVLWLQPSRFRRAIAEPRGIIQSAAHRYRNLHVVDWGAETARNTHYTRSDGIHLQGRGPKALAQFMADNLDGTVPWNRIPEGDLSRVKVNKADVRAGQRTPRVRVKGWAYDPDLISKPWVRITVDGQLVRAAQTTNVRRPSLARNVGHPNDLIGFDRLIRLRRGTRELCIEVNNRDGLPPVELSCRTIKV